MPLLEEIGDALEADGHGTQGTDIFIGDTPQTSPDNAVSVLETSGLAPLFAHNISGVNVEQPTFQVYTRNGSYSAARQKAEDIYQFLNQQVNVTLGGIRYPRIVALQAPFSIGRDDNHRSQIVCNFAVRKGLG